MSSSHSCMFFGVYCLHRNQELKWGLPCKVHQGFYKMIMESGTSQDTRWTWLQMNQRLKREAEKCWGPRRKMREFICQAPLSKPRGKWRQGSACNSAKVLENMRSNTEETRTKLGQVGPRPDSPGRLAQPTLGSVRHPLWPRRLSGYL
jgi:hypothetical protein